MPWVFLLLPLLAPSLAFRSDANPISLAESKVLVVDPDSSEVVWETTAFRAPMGVRALSGDRFLVSDFGTARVAIIDRNQDILAEYPANNPEDARLLPNGDVLIVNNGNSQVALVGQDGIVQQVWETGLDHPASAYLNADGQVVIADTNHRRIVVMDLEGQEEAVFDRFQKPMTLEPTDAEGFLLADMDSQKVGEWTLEGVSRWELAGFLQPSDVKLSEDGNVVVADSGNFRVVEVSRSGKLLRSVQFTQKPVSVDVTEKGEWVVAVPYDPNSKPTGQVSGPISPEFAPLASQGGTNGAPGQLFSSPFVLVAILFLLFAVFLGWMKFRRPGEKAPKEKSSVPPSVWMKIFLIGAFLAANLAIVVWYTHSSQVSEVRLVCASHRIDLFFGEQALGQIASLDLPEEGEIGLTFWQEGKNHQRLQSVSFTPSGESKPTYYADFTAKTFPEGWSFDPKIWNHEPGEGVWTTDRGHQDLWLSGHQFGSGVLKVTLKNPAEFAVAVRKTSPVSFSRFYLRPQRHLDTWVETRSDGQKMEGLSKSLARVAPSFDSQVQSYLRLIVRHYFFAWYLLVLGSILFAALYLTLFLIQSLITRTGFHSNLPETARKRVHQGVVLLCLLAVLILSVWSVRRAHWVSESVLDEVPHLQDSVAYLFQAKILAGGALYVDSPPSPYLRFFDHEFIVNNGKRYGLYTPGFPLLLAVGLLFNDPWWVNPILGGLSVLLIFLCGWSIYGIGLGVLAAVFLAISPWFHFMSGTLISHPASLLCTLMVVLGLSEATKPRGFWPYILAGIGLGMLILVRSGNSLVVGVPAILWSLGHLAMTLRRDWGERQKAPSPQELREEDSVGSEEPGELEEPSPKQRFWDGETVAAFVRYAAMGAVCIGFIAFLGYYNWRLTGNPKLSTYNAYSPHIKLGFSPDVGVEWGTGHDRLNAINNLVSNLNEFYRFWFVPTPVSAPGWEKAFSGYLKYWVFAPVFAVFVFLDRKPASYLLLAMILGTLIFQYCYFHSGISYGARFYYDLIGPLSLLTARGCWMCASFLPRIVSRGEPGSRSPLALISAGVVTVLLAFPVWTPSSYDEGTKLIQSFRNYNGLNSRTVKEVEGEKLKNAVVFVDSAGSWIPYGRVFWSMSPWLDGEVVYARDQGVHNVPKPGNTPLDNKLLLDLYPDRTFYKLEGSRLRKLDWSP